MVVRVEYKITGMEMKDEIQLNSLVIISNSGENTLGVAILEAVSGELSAIKSVHFPEISGNTGACPLAVSPDQRTLYLSFRGTQSRILSFRINHDAGTLEYLGQNSLPDSMVHISTDETGRFLFSASYGGGIVAVSAIGADGVVGEVTQVCQAEPKAHCTVVTPDNRFVLVPSIDADAVLRYAFDIESGQIQRCETPAATVPQGSGPRHLICSSNYQFCYLINELNGTITAFSTRKNAILSPIQTVGVTPTGFTQTASAADIHLTPDGLFLYASDRGSNTLAGYRVNQTTGTLDEVCKISVAAVPRGFEIDPSGKWLLLAAQDAGTITVYGIDAGSGALEERQVCESGSGPNWVEIIPMSGSER